MNKFFCVVCILLLAACSSPPKPTIPALTPQAAGELLHYSNKADDWLKYVKRRDPSCEYRIELPDQSNHPEQIDLGHIVWCGNRPSPKEFDASISFVYDRDAKRWVISRFAS